MSKISENLISKLKECYKQDIKIIESSQISIDVKIDIFMDVIKKLKDYCFDFLVDLTAVEEEGLSCVYHFMSLVTKEVVRVKVKLNEKLEIESLTNYWLAANVQEREVYDLFGINFIGHPDLKRILCPDDFVGHPLRKEFKVEKRR
jgi:NADH:ubiquinone oxidoreductase 27 kD subunit